MNPFPHLARLLSGNRVVIALLTDCGTTDQYVGSMKGVIAGIAPYARVVDISHEVQPQQIRQAGYLLWSAYKYFPERTIFVCVVDPGVGSKRRILALRTGKQTFLAPDNMLLDFILSEEKNVRGFEVTTQNNPYVLPNISSTFHGRDIFAPIAAYLSLGFPLSKVGRGITIHPAMSPFLDVGKERSSKGEILHIDRFGNLITNLRAWDGRAALKQIKALVVNGKKIQSLIMNYAEAPDRTACMILGSSNLIEIIVKQGDAARALKAAIGNPVKVLWT